MLPFRLSNKRARVGAEYSDHGKHGEDTSPLKGEDAYFGASRPTSEMLLEEFGFVPCVNKQPIIDESIWDEEPVIVFHENEYDGMQEIYQTDSPPNARVALRDLSNLFLGNGLLTIDKQLEQEVENSMTTTKRSTAKDLIAERSILSSSAAMEHSMFQNGTAIDHSSSGITVEHLMIPTSAKAQNSAVKRKTLGKRPPPANDEFNSIDLKSYEIRNERFAEDMYTPRIVRGSGMTREGLCQICKPGVWLKIKQSAYWYHMNFIHGISANTGRPYEPPLATREKQFCAHNGAVIKQFEGRCGQCDKWVVLQKVPLGEKQTECCNPQWWRHSQKCSSDMAKGIRRR
ncbi:Conserved fungal protein [Paramicrosporidium saccamoebae]|uniref:Conserved fungal protein n=1 Tax=Paramicrosporidium saccamoebae TaxID=1246581 RepID=A0A2H9TK54_9FUNG|nr:Conserved fungal protein [Paramicrosporidium saccamoebae]